MNGERTERAMQFRVGIFVIGAVLAFLGLVYLLGARARLFESHYTIHADFTEVGGLADAATVRLAGVQIGRVTGVHLPSQPGGKVRIDIMIARRFADRIRQDSVARIETQGLLGDKIVEITVGTAAAPPVAPGGTIASREPADIGQVIARTAETVQSVSGLAESLRETAKALNQSRLIEDASATVKAARDVTGKVGRLVDQVESGRGWAHALLYEEPVALRQLNDTMATAQRLLARVEHGEGAAGVLTSPDSTAAARRLVAAMDRLAGMVDRPEAEQGLLPALLADPKYKGVLDDARVLAHNLRDVSDRIAGGRGMIGGLVKDEPEDASIRQASRDLQAALANLKSITTKINEGQGTLGALIVDPTLYDRLSAVLEGASRSFLLRSLIRGLGHRGEEAKPRAEDGKPRVEQSKPRVEDGKPRAEEPRR